VDWGVSNGGRRRRECKLGLCEEKEEKAYPTTWDADRLARSMKIREGSLGIAL
jgi:hypothetical protein